MISNIIYYIQTKYSGINSTYNYLIFIDVLIISFFVPLAQTNIIYYDTTVIILPTKLVSFYAGIVFLVTF